MHIANVPCQPLLTKVTMFGRLGWRSFSHHMLQCIEPRILDIHALSPVCYCSHADLQKLNAELAGLESSYSSLQDNLFKELCDKVMHYRKSPFFPFCDLVI